MCGPRLIYPDGTPQRCCNRFPGLASVFKRLLLQSFVKSAWVDDAYAEELADRPFRPDWMMATSLVIRKKALDEVGPYDEQFVIYYEEVDLALRLKRAGWEVSFVPEALVRHHHGLSNLKLRNERDILFRLLLYQSRYRYFRKNGGPVLSLLIRGLEAGFFGLFTLKTRLEAMLPSRRDGARLKAQLYGSLLQYALRCRPAYAIPQPGE
jgi:GT2 family glycosyltransferase